jgi:hypothetical protein
VDISGANGAFYIPQVAGSYSVSTFYGTCSSESVYFNPQLNIQTLKVAGINLYPNPVSDELNIEVNETFIGKSFQLFSSTGELIKKGKLDSKINRISLTKLPSGPYFIEVSGTHETLPFVKK